MLLNVLNNSYTFGSSLGNIFQWHEHFDVLLIVVDLPPVDFTTLIKT